MVSFNFTQSLKLLTATILSIASSSSFALQDSDSTSPYSFFVTPAGLESVDVFLKGDNNGNSPINGTVQWKLNGKRVGSNYQFHDVKPGSVFQSRIELTPWIGENALTASISVQGQKANTTRLRFFGQPFAGDVPVIDGELDDWYDYDGFKLLPYKHQIIPPVEDRLIDQDEFSGYIRTCWHWKSLFVSADVTDTTPLEGSSDETVTWKGDSLEILIGKGGTHTQDLEDIYRLIISPDEEDKGIIWLSKGLDSPPEKLTGTSVYTVYNSNGYVVEAQIPVEAIGLDQASQGMLFALNYRLNNQHNTQKKDPDEVLVWSGSADTWTDPAHWGASRIVSTGRIQLPDTRTFFEKSDVATKDSKFLSPLPVECPELAEYLPAWLQLDMPFKGSFEIGNAYGLESNSWTHQTIGNQSSANDYFAIDIDTPIGTPVYASATGTIVTSGRRGDSYGNYIVLDHGRGYTTYYAHLDKVEFLVDRGEPEIEVQQGDLIGYTGRSGTFYPHLHFGAHLNARTSHSGCDVGGISIVPEPLGGFYGLRAGQVLTGE